jgi:hypothetical protein
MTLGTYHQIAGRADVVAAWLAKHQAAGRPAFAIAEDLYSTGGRYRLLGCDAGPYSIKREHDLTAQGFQRATERNYYAGDTAYVWLSANELAVAFVAELHAAQDRERAEADAKEIAQRAAQAVEYEKQQAFRTELDAKLSTAKFKKASVRTIARDGVTPLEFTGVAYAGLLVHRTQGRDARDKAYGITHITSGMSCCNEAFASQSEAKAAVVRLANLGDWTRDKAAIEADKELRAIAGPLMRHMEKTNAYTVI